MSTEDRREGATHRAGFVALLGPPNAGKSTLLNRLIGEKLAIVTAKPQTTRSRILGICSRAGAQILFVDTPGLHESPKVLNAALNDAVETALEACDVALLLVDRTRGWEDAHTSLHASAQKLGRPVVVIETKDDLEARREVDLGPAEAERIAVSAKTGAGVDSLIDRIVELLPESPPLYDAASLTDRPLRWLAAELVREAAFERLGHELPYSMAVDVVRFDESREGLVEIHANLLVERNSQKRIVVGKGGSVVKQIGVRARREIEKLVGCQVHLRLFVKVDPKWLKNPDRIEALGYH